MYKKFTGMGGARRCRLLLRIVMYMKIVCFVMLVTALHVHAVSLAQITIKEQAAPLEQVFNEIRKQSGFNILYVPELLDRAKPVTLNLKDASLQQALAECLDGQGLGYRIVDNNVVIMRQRANNVQTKLTGRVTDEQGRPLVGATVRGKAAGSAATQTGRDGTFELTLTEAPEILVFRMLGFETLELPVGNQTEVNAVLKASNTGLDEIVVVGYGVQRKSDVNAAIVSVKPDQLVKTGNPSLAQMLEGRAAGLTVMENSAQPGGGTTLLIRGAASVGAGNDPLIVIDGFPVSNNNTEPRSGNRYSMGSRNILNTINPNDIASVEILKDVSATAIYGARAANGVILITTKRGAANTVRFEYAGDYTVQQIAKRPELLSARELKTETNRYLHEEYLLANKIYPYGDTDPSVVSPFIPRYSEADIAATGSGTDWYGAIMQQGLVNQHNASLTAGTDKIKLMLSGNYFDQQGVLRTSGLRRYSARLNLDHQVTRWLDYGVSLLGSKIHNKNAALGGGMNENSGIIQSAMIYSPMIGTQRQANGEYLINPTQALIPNPLSFLDVVDFSDNTRWLMNSFAKAQIDPYAAVKVSVGFDNDRGIRKNYLPKTFMYGKGQNGVANINEIEKTDYLFEATFNYNRRFNDDRNSLSGVLGYSYQHFNNEGLILYAYDFFTDAFLFNKMSVGEGLAGIDSYRGTSVLASYFGRVQYGINDRYLFTVTARVDGSDKFGANNKYGFFPSAAFAWRIVDEPFLQDATGVSDLKLRVSAGQTGNSNIGNNAYEYYDAAGRNYIFSGLENTGVNLSQLANPNLKWETTTEYNLGVDYGFFKNRLSGSVDVFYKEIHDLLGSRRLMSSSIVGSVPANLGRTQSKGLEIAVNSVNIDGPLKWSTSFNLTSFRDKWLERSPDVILAPYQSAKDPIRAIFEFIPEGIIQPGETVTHMPQAIPGMMKIRDVDGDGKINVNDMVLVGSNDPKFTMGLGNQFAYKGFDLQVFFYAALGAKRWSHLNFWYGAQNELLKIKDGNNFLTTIKDRWAHDNTSAETPSGFRNPYLLDGNYGHEDGSYLRLRNVTLGYDLKQQFAGLKGISNLRIYVTGQNLFTITKFSGLDPQIEDSSAPYPLQRAFSLGLNLTL